MTSEKKRERKPSKSLKGGLRVHLIIGLTVLVLLILGIVWIFQVLLLDFFYEKTKLSQLDEVQSYIERYIDSDDLDVICSDLASKHDVCISVYRAENGNLGERIINKEVSPTCVIHYSDNDSLSEYYTDAINAGGSFTQRYTFSAGRVSADGKREDSDSSAPAGELKKKDDSRLLVVAVAVKALLDSDGNEYAIFINLEFTPISAVQQTRNTQFWYITCIVLFLTVLFAWFFSGRISGPLERMTAEAERMADRGYKASFDEEGCMETRMLANALNYAVDEIAKTDKLQKELIANVSHDLRTPLTLIAGYAEMMRDIPGENSSENCQYIIDETKRLTTLVNDMLDFSKYNSGFETPDFKELDLTDSVRTVIDRYAELIRHEGYTIVFIAEENVKVFADVGMILQVIYNLLNNAINYTGADKTVRIWQTMVSDKKVRITISDSGIGIDESDIEKVWDRYYSENRAHKRAIVGSGIGLSIVSRLLRLHSASYGVESAKGIGTSFWFELEVCDQ